MPLQRVPPEKPLMPPAEPKLLIKRLPIAPDQEAFFQPPPAPPPAPRPPDNFAFDYNAFKEVLDFLNAPRTVEFMGSTYADALVPKTDPFVPYPDADDVDAVDRRRRRRRGPSMRGKFTRQRTSTQATAEREPDEPFEDSDDVFVAETPGESKTCVREASVDGKSHGNDSLNLIVDEMRVESSVDEEGGQTEAAPLVATTATTAPVKRPTTVRLESMSTVARRATAASHKRDQTSDPLTPSPSDDETAARVSRQIQSRTTQSRSEPQSHSQRQRQSSAASSCSYRSSAHTASPTPKHTTTRSRGYTARHAHDDDAHAGCSSSYESRDRGRGRDVYRESRSYQADERSRDEMDFNDRTADSFNRSLSNADGGQEYANGELCHQSY